MKRITSWSCCLALVLLGSACSKQEKQQNGDATGAQNSANVALPDGAGASGSAPRVQQKDLGALADLIVAEDAELPRAEFDPAALVAALGRDPQKLHAWVRDRTWWAPYRGLLRGPKGVMLDRLGSNLDRAVLLGDLLRRAGFAVRLAHAQLPENRARELLAKVPPIPDRRRTPLEPHAMPAERQRALEAIIPGLAQQVQQQAAESRQLASEAVTLVRSQSDQLHAAAGAVASRNSHDDRLMIAALRDYWWVEREDHGRWATMDVLLPDATPGDALASASETIDWKAQAEWPLIPEADWHTVQVRVVVERYAAGATTESTVLETTLHPAEVLDRPIVLGHFPKPWPETLPSPKADPNALGNAAVNVKEWVPFLRIGTSIVAQSGFAESGDLIAGPFDPKRDIAKVGGGGMMGGFDAALGGGEVAASFLTAEWLDYEIRVPGEPSQRLRRPVFDLLGPTKRLAKVADFDASTNTLLIERSEALLSRTDILLQPCEFSSEFVAALATRGIVANQAAIKALSREREPVRVRDLLSGILGQLDRWGPLPDLVLWRSALGGQPAGWFIDRPNVLNYRAMRPVVNADRASLRELLDVASNPIGVRSGASTDAFEARLHQGVADTVAEVLALGGDLRMADNAASIFAAAGVGPDRTVLIKPRDAESVRKLGWPEDVSARLGADVDAGFAAVVIKTPIVVHERERLGWWRVDPTSGETIGVMDTGFHGAAEDAEMRQQVNALENFLSNNSTAISQARNARVLTPGQSLLLRTAQAAERALEAFACMSLPFPC